MGVGAISATESPINNTISTDNQQNANEIIDVSYDEDILRDSPKTIVVPFDPKESNEMTWPKIQPAIDGANAGDTIVIEGNPAHCRLTINKKLNIIATEKSTITPCPNYYHEGLSDFGVFYITKEGNGSTIQGFTFLNTHKSETPFGILIDGADDINIFNCTMNFHAKNDDRFQGIIIKNSNNVKLSNLVINNTINGITIIDSSNIEIKDCLISNNENYAISVFGNSKNINIRYNFIKDNGNSGINLSSANYVNILNNHIENNGADNKDSGSGIYVNTNITKLVVTGNIFLSNGLHAIMYDYRTRNLNKNPGDDMLTVVDDNYFEGHSSMMLHHRIYIEYANGDMQYDAEKDIYFESANGNYLESKSYVYMQNALIFNDVPCGFTYYTVSIPWTLSAQGNNGKYDLSLKLNLKETKKGVYQISIVDSKGNIASNFNSFYVPVFLNDCSSVTPQNGDIYRNVLIKDGVGIADFRSSYSSFKSKNNIITAVFPGTDENVIRSLYVQLKIDDSNLPINPPTKLTASILTTYPLSDDYVQVKLTDSKVNAIPNQKVTFKFNSKTYDAITDNMGIAKVKVSLSSIKTYSVAVTYLGNDDYDYSQTLTKIIVKSGSKKSKISASNLKVKRNVKKVFRFKVTDGVGGALKNQKVIVKLNGKSHIIKTNNKGIAKLPVKLNKAKKYRCTIRFLGNANFKPSSKTSIICVTKK